MLTNAPRGTKDILPDTVGHWTYVEEKIREICKHYGFHELRTPIFEHTELFQRGIGEGTDVVDKEMYTFTDQYYPTSRKHGIGSARIPSEQTLWRQFAREAVLHGIDVSLRPSAGRTYARISSIWR